MTASTPDNFAVSGTWGEVRYAVDAQGRMPAKEFVEGLSTEDVKKVLLLLRRLATDGKITNREKFRKERGEIFALKAFQIRIPCFQHERTWYLTYGFTKKGDNWKAADLDRADRIRLEHLNRP